MPTCWRWCKKSCTQTPMSARSGDAPVAFFSEPGSAAGSTGDEGVARHLAATRASQLRAALPSPLLRFVSFVCFVVPTVFFQVEPELRTGNGVAATPRRRWVRATPPSLFFSEPGSAAGSTGDEGIARHLAATRASQLRVGFFSGPSARRRFPRRRWGEHPMAVRLRCGLCCPD